ncbi:MAG: IS1634 family transposase [Deltaproteobacteria bacterium]|nr:IS1634 family transposase [Deltaproteobacteria bacterium]MBW1907268.1 IS1634 family transposase [Deltaproteobacteria bacterium]
MASLTKKTIHGRSYYYLRETAWVDGRSKVVKTTYLGSVEAVLAALGKGPCALTLVPGAPVHEFGAVAALWDLASRLGVVKIIDRHLPKRGKGPSVGTLLVLAALNRAICPTSKAKLGAWYERSALRRLVGLAPRSLSSQRFWDNMDRVTEEHLVAIERDLAERVTDRYELDLECLFYDATNFFTFIDSFNARSKLAQRGKSKEGRSSLRIVGLALLVCGPDQVPLFHRLYAGNHNDPTSFRSVLGELTERLRLLSHGAHGITLVFDKGNNTDDAVAALRGECHVVGSLVPSHHKELLAVQCEEMQRLSPERFEREVLCLRTKKEIFGRSYTVLVTWNEALFTAQVTTIERELAKCALRLAEEEARLERWRCGAIKGGRRPSEAAVRKRVAKMLRSRHMKDLFQITVESEEEHRGLPRLTWEFDAGACDELKKTLLGKTLLFTDNEAWSDEDIVTAYRGQHHVESAFRQMKDTHHVSFRPAHHWTDDKLRVHAFTCVLALMLCSLLRKELTAKGIPLSIDAMLESLGSIREVHMMLRSPGPGRPRTRSTHSELDPLAARLFEALDLASMLPT